MPIKDKQKKAEYNRTYRQKNKERLAKKRKEWESKNKDYLKKYHKEYHKKWYQEHKEERQQQIREYAKDHKEDAVRRVQKYVKNNKEKVDLYNKEYQQSPAGLYRTTKYNAGKRGKQWELNPESFKKLVLSPCHYCGETQQRRGIDRVDNNKGYTKQNSVSCCKLCNYMKKHYTVEEFISHIKKIYKHQNVKGLLRHNK